MFRHVKHLRFPGWTGLLSIVLVALFISAETAVGLPPTGNPCGDCADPCGCEIYCAPPRCPWYVEAGGVFLKRDTRGGAPIATLGTGLTPENILLTSGELNAAFRGGPRLLLGHTFGQTAWQMDFTYFWVDSWIDSKAVRDYTENDEGGIGNLFSPFSNFGEPPIIGYDYNNFLSIREVSNLQNGELNLRYTFPMPNESVTAKFLIGIRYLSLNERFDYLSQSQIPLPLGSATAISTRTTNDLIGPQIGGDFYFFAFPRCWINFEFKGALCANRALQDTAGILTDAGVDTPVSGRRSRNATAFVGDLNLQAVWQVTPRMLTRIGYQVMWVESVALASRNFGPLAGILELGPAQIDTSHGAVYHGPRIDLEWVW
ncbi:MAG: BBP7 family outer membrane beta-barrel protein [Pirellulales bacterium]|nr:BBP7 family outer membrane beta-barrel protein [Pirellulales bacterium]